MAFSIIPLSSQSNVAGWSLKTFTKKEKYNKKRFFYAIFYNLFPDEKLFWETVSFQWKHKEKDFEGSIFLPF
jgi:hypothetical protein